MRTRSQFGGFGSLPTLTWNDLKAIQEEIPAVRHAAPYLRTTAQVVSEEQNWTTSVCGTTPEYFEIRSWPMAAGAAFTASDVDTGGKVAVLGRTVVDKLYGPSGIGVLYADYAGYPEYRQLHPPFVHTVSVIDLLLNEGSQAHRYLKHSALARHGTGG